MISVKTNQISDSNEGILFISCANADPTDPHFLGCTDKVSGNEKANGKSKNLPNSSENILKSKIK